MLGVSGLRVAHIISNLGAGGAEGSLYRLIKSVPGGSGLHAVITFKSGGVNAALLRKLGVAVHELGTKTSLGGIWRMPGLTRTLRHFKPDIVQGWMYHGNVAATLSQRFASRPAKVCWNVRQTSSRLHDDKLLTQPLILAGAPLSKFCSQIIYNSWLSAEQHERYGYARDKRRVIHNGIDCDEFMPIPGSHARLCDLLKVPAGSRLIGRIGRKAKMKDHVTMFRAFAELARDPLNQLVLIGHGMDRHDSDLAKWANDTGAPARVHFLGARSDIAELLPGLDVNVSSSSTSEGFPNVVAEGMACGVPAVATDVGESLLILSDPDRIVPPGEPGALADRISRVLALPEVNRELLGRRDRTRMLQEFSISKAVKAYLETWNDCLA